MLDGFSRRLQTQETLTAQVADAIQTALQPRGVAVLIDAQHQCMTTRGVHKPDVSMVTTRFTALSRQIATCETGSSTRHASADLPAPARNARRRMLNFL